MTNINKYSLIHTNSPTLSVVEHSLSLTNKLIAEYSFKPLELWNNLSKSWKCFLYLNWFHNQEFVNIYKENNIQTLWDLYEKLDEKKQELYGWYLDDISSLKKEDINEIFNVEYVYITYQTNDIADIIPLKHFSSLKSLFISHYVSWYDQQSVFSNIYSVSDFSPISELKNLKALNLYDNQIRDIKPLKHLVDLECLDLSNNQITDLIPLVNLKKLKNLNLHSNELEEISILAELTNLEHIELSYNKIADVSALAYIKNLKYLNLSSNQVSDITPLTNLLNLQELYLHDNPLQPHQIDYLEKKIGSFCKINI